VGPRRDDRDSGACRHREIELAQRRGEHFVERLFAQARLRELFDSKWRPSDLIAFHSRHKLQILAHHPAAYRETGRIVAQASTRNRDDLETVKGVNIRPRGRDLT
jgi:hypothetical protein